MKKLLILLLCALMVLPSAARADAAPSADRLPDETLMTYFDHSLFIGDSVVRMFRNYVKDVQKKDPGYFSGVKFYSAYNYQLFTATMEYINTNRVNLTYKGSDVTMAEIMRREQPARLFILAGLNELIHQNIPRADRYIPKIMALRDKYSPETEVYFLSLTPVTQKIGSKRQNGHNEYNLWLEQKCAEVGASYIEISARLKDETGFLPKKLSIDGEFHLNTSGNAIFAQELLDYAQAQYEKGLWAPKN
jgi:hypothetical protein